MTVDDKRTERRLPVALRIKLRYTRIDQFISKFATNLSRGGMFLSSRSPKPVGTRLHFELRLADDSPVIEGLGEVRWIRDYDRSRPDLPHGMGIQFLKLEEASQALIDQAIGLRKARGDADLDRIPRGRLVRRRMSAAPIVPEGDDDDLDLEDEGAVEAGPEAGDAPTRTAGEAPEDVLEDLDDPAIEPPTRIVPDVEDPGSTEVADAAPEPQPTGGRDGDLEPHVVSSGRRPPGRLTQLLADRGSDLVDDRGHRVADAVRRARELAHGLATAEVDKELADLLELDAVPVATVDQASRELASRELGSAVESTRYRAPHVAAIAPGDEGRRPASARAGTPGRAETIDAALLALEEEEERGGGILDQLAAARHAEDSAVLAELGALRQASLAAGRLGTEIPIDIDDDDVLEQADVEVDDDDDDDATAAHDDGEHHDDEAPPRAVRKP